MTAASISYRVILSSVVLLSLFRKLWVKQYPTDNLNSSCRRATFITSGPFTLRPPSLRRSIIVQWCTLSSIGCIESIGSLFNVNPARARLCWSETASLRSLEAVIWLLALRRSCLTVIMYLTHHQKHFLSFKLWPGLPSVIKLNQSDL
jgi:hypothetical protein